MQKSGQSFMARLIQTPMQMQSIRTMSTAASI